MMLASVALTLGACAESPGFKGSIGDSGIEMLDGGSTRLFGDENRWASTGIGATTQATVDKAGAQQQAGGGAPVGLFTVILPDAFGGGLDATGNPIEGRSLTIALAGASDLTFEDVEVNNPFINKPVQIFKAKKVTRSTTAPGRVAVDLATAEAERLKALPEAQRDVAIETLKQQAEAGSKIAAAVLEVLGKMVVPAP